MGIKICHNCGEKVITLVEKCPKCGIIPNQSTSPVFIGIIIMTILILVVIAGLFLSNADAQFYQWVDKQGVKHFTDNLLEVPKDQRPNIVIHKSTKSPEKKDTPTDLEPSPENSLKSKKNKLDSEKSALDKEYKALQEKRKTILAQQKTIAPKQYNELIQKLNAGIIAFEQKRLSYEAKIEAYNKQVKTGNKK